jgi:hypothetical protein
VRARGFDRHILFHVLAHSEGNSHILDHRDIHRTCLYIDDETVSRAMAIIYELNRNAGAVK